MVEGIGIACPICGASAGAGVKDSRSASDNSFIRRRRQCMECGNRFSTVEIAADPDGGSAAFKTRLYGPVVRVPEGMNYREAYEVLKWWQGRPKAQD
jgi:hypothetical protein